MLLRVLGKTLVEAREWVVELGLVDGAGDDAVHAQVNTVVDVEATIHRVVSLIKISSAQIGALEALLLTVLVNAPEVVYTFVDGLLVGVAAEERRGQRKESDILHLQLEDG